MNLTEFLLTRIAEDEAAARACVKEVGSERVGDSYSDGSGVAELDAFPSYPYGSGAAELVYMARAGHPARVLAECEAKRRIVEEARNEIGPTAELDWLLPLLALPYADHEDYQEDWRP